ncbi:MAG TPA: hypothetical protein PLQ69_04230 [Paludibacter sp.]|jgi:hypothetical protein|nr:hypothetical protein [Paludibacter sp.]
MAKVQKISQLQPTLGFTEFDIYASYRESFYLSELGKLYRAFPFSISKKGYCSLLPYLSRILKIFVAIFSKFKVINNSLFHYYIRL